MILGSISEIFFCFTVQIFVSDFAFLFQTLFQFSKFSCGFQIFVWKSVSDSKPLIATTNFWFRFCFRSHFSRDLKFIKMISEFKSDLTSSFIFLHIFKTWRLELQFWNFGIMFSNFVTLFFVQLKYESFLWISLCSDAFNRKISSSFFHELIDVSEINLDILSSKFEPLSLILRWNFCHKLKPIWCFIFGCYRSTPIALLEPITASIWISSRVPRYRLRSAGVPKFFITERKDPSPIFSKLVSISSVVLMN